MAASDSLKHGIWAFIVAVTLSCSYAGAQPGKGKFQTLGAEDNANALAVSIAPVPQSEELVSLAGGPNVWRADEPATSGGLWGKKIAIEIGHGRTWRGTDWRWQREDWFPGLHVHSSQEDYNNPRFILRWFLPYLRSAGAEVYPDRCPDEQVNEVIMDLASTGAPHSSTGTWDVLSDSRLTDGMFISSSTTQSTSPTSTFLVRADIPVSGYYGVTIRYPRVSFLTQDCSMSVIDAAGNRHPFVVDQTRNQMEWVWLDRFYFDAGTSVPVLEIFNNSGQEGRNVAIDAVRLGGGMGSVDFGGGPSGVPRWQETAICWFKFNGVPPPIWEPDVTAAHDTNARYYHASYKKAELLLRYHSNGSVYHTGFGSEVYQYAPDAERLSLLGYIYPKVVQSIRTHYRPNWVDRGVKANSISGWQFPVVLLELAFHDWLTDAQALMDADFRRVAMRGFYEGVVDYFTNKSGIYLPEPPENLSLKTIGGNTVRAEWTSSTIGSAPDSYRVYYSTHPHCYKDYVETSAPATSVELGPLDAGKIYYFQFRSWNQGGLSLPSETLAAMVSGVPNARTALLVNGFDRFDWDIDETDNQRNYCIEHAKAIADAATSLAVAVNIDSAANEAVASGKHTLSGYDLVDWMLGQESVSEETFNLAEQLAVDGFRANKGVLLVTGTDLATDVGTSGTVDDQDFMRTALGMEMPVGRVSSVEKFDGFEGSVFDGLKLEVENTTATYNLLGTDLLAAAPASSIAFANGDNVFGVQATGLSNAVITLSVPFEDIAGADNRRAVMERILPLLPDKSAISDWSVY